MQRSCRPGGVQGYCTIHTQADNQFRVAKTGEAEVGALEAPCRQMVSAAQVEHTLGSPRVEDSEARVTFQASAASSLVARETAIISLTKAVPRSNENVTMAIRHPSFSAPTRFRTGIRTSSKKTSLYSIDPWIARRGRISVPGVRMSRMSQEIPLCFGPRDPS